jgi:hypothetical protein
VKFDFKEWFSNEPRYRVAAPTTDNLTSHVRKAQRLLIAMREGRVREIREIQQWLLANGQNAPESESEAERLIRALKKQNGTG